MGLFKTVRDAQKQSKEYRKAGNEWLAGDPESLSQLPGAPAGLDDLLRYRDLSQKIATAGVDAPAVLTAIDRGAPLPGGNGLTATFGVTIAPADGDPYPAVITQPMMEAQLDDVSVGQAITVRYDPDEPTSALIYSW